MRLVDFYPSQGSYSPGETVTFLIELESSESQNIKLRILLRHLADQPITLEETFDVAAGEQIVQMRWAPPVRPAGYSACLEIRSTIDSSLLQATTAFDVLAKWTDFPRYGFLTDFSSSRPDPKEAPDRLTRFHINGLQF